MFLLNLAYRWSLASSVDEINGVLYLPYANTLERLSRNAAPVARRVFFDPQLYLATLDAAKCPTACSRLATYPWFYAEIDRFDSDESTRRDWEKRLKETIGERWPSAVPDDTQRQGACVSAVEFQAAMSCTHILLPTPLVSEREDEAATMAEWIDAGLAACESLDIGQPIVTTVAIDEGSLNDTAFDAGGFLDTIIDQVTSREGSDGVYIVIAQTQAKQHPFATDSRVLRAYLRLTRVFRRAGLQVFVNFAGDFGEVCVAAGANGFASGASHSLRRLSLADFEEPSFGYALPKYYSHAVVGEFLTETHLNVVVAQDAFDRIRDVTPYSEALIEALEAGGTAADIPEWAESRNNTAEAYRHYVARLAIEAALLRRQPPIRRRNTVRTWLEGASAICQQLIAYFEEEDVSPPLCAPCETWGNLLDSVDD